MGRGSSARLKLQNGGDDMATTSIRALIAQDEQQPKLNAAVGRKS